MSDIVILKYNAGNIQSVLHTLNRLGVSAIVTDDISTIKAASKVIFPGVGEASTAMAYLRQRNLDKVIRELTQPFLGVCLGLQLMCRHSEENDTECLGIFDIAVKKFPTLNKEVSFKVPEMGWNSVNNLKSPLYQGIQEGSYVYFVHSYYAELNPCTISSTLYSAEFSSGIAKNNFYAVQYHPEKSASVGAKLLENFLAL